MKCREYKEAIYLLEELSSIEREKLLLHVQSCDDCKQLFTETQRFSTLIRRASSEKPVLIHPVGTTDSIMNHIWREKNDIPKQNVSWVDFLSTVWTRYALAGLSICLLAFFLFEINEPVYSGKNVISSVATSYSEVVLKTKVLRETYSKHKESKPFFLSQCNTNGSGKIDLSCLREKLVVKNF